MTSSKPKEQNYTSLASIKSSSASSQYVDIFISNAWPAYRFGDRGTHLSIVGGGDLVGDLLELLGTTSDQSDAIPFLREHAPE